MAIRVSVTSVPVNDQQKALAFYTEKLGFLKKTEVPVGDAWWLTVVSPADPDGVEVLLEPVGNPAVPLFAKALAELRQVGIPWTSFAVDDLAAEIERLRDLGVTIVQEPVKHGPVTVAMIDDTCGNLIQLAQMDEE